MAIATACERCYHNKAHAGDLFTQLADHTSSHAMAEACNWKRAVLYIAWIHDEGVACLSTMISPWKFVLA